LHEKKEKMEPRVITDKKANKRLLAGWFGGQLPRAWMHLCLSVFICGFISFLARARGSRLACESRKVSARWVIKCDEASTRLDSWAGCSAARAKKNQHEDHKEHKDHEVHTSPATCSLLVPQFISTPSARAKITKDFVIFASFVIFVLNLSFSCVRWGRTCRGFRRVFAMERSGWRFADPPYAGDPLMPADG
jgi:hypothetical protein